MEEDRRRGHRSCGRPPRPGTRPPGPPSAPPQRGSRSHLWAALPGRAHEHPGRAPWAGIGHHCPKGVLGAGEGLSQPKLGFQTVPTSIMKDAGVQTAPLWGQTPAEPPAASDVCAHVALLPAELLGPEAGRGMIWDEGQGCGSSDRGAHGCCFGKPRAGLPGGGSRTGGGEGPGASRQGSARHGVSETTPSLP